MLVRVGVEDVDLPRLATRAGAICGQIKAFQETNRRILRRLRPPALDDLGLAAALRSLVDGWRETQPDVRIDLFVPEDFDVEDASQRFAAYRLVQEALTNVFRHSGTQNVHITLVADARGSLRVVVEDDGVFLHGIRTPALG